MTKQKPRVTPEKGNPERERERGGGGEQAAAAAESRRLARRKSRSRRASRDRVNARAQGPLFRAAEPTPPAPALPARAAASRASLSPFGLPRSPRTGWVVELVSTRCYHLGAPSEHASRKTSLRRSFVHTFAGGDSGRGRTRLPSPAALLRHASASGASKFGPFLFPACARSGGKTLVRDGRSAKSDDAVPVYAKAALIVAAIARGAATGL